MKPLRVPVFCLLTYAVTLLFSTPARADFSGPYSVDAWTVSGGMGYVDFSAAPAQVTLSVPSSSFYANDLNFTIVAAGTGAVNFNALMVSPGLNSIFWQQYRGGALVSWTDLGPGLGPGAQPFSFPVQAGDQFGFSLWSGSDAITPGQPLNTILTVEDFSAPIPEPGVLGLRLAGSALLLARRKTS